MPTPRTETLDAATAATWFDLRPDGVIVWRKSPKPSNREGTPAGTPSNGGVQICLRYRLYSAERLAHLLRTGTWPSGWLPPRRTDA